MSRIVHISTLGGPHAVSPSDFISFVESAWRDPVACRKLRFLSKEAGISGKHSILPDFQASCSSPLLYRDASIPPGTEQRMAVFRNHAPAFAERVAKKALEACAWQGEDLDAIVTVSCTGITAPGLEIELSSRLGLRPDAERHAVNFMGCYAAFHGLRLAHLICRSRPHAKVLVVCVELCSLHFRDDSSDDNLLSTALFSDGAAAVLLAGEETSTPSLAQLEGFSSTLIHEGRKSMAWDVGNTGFEMVLHRSIPNVVETQMAEAFQRFLVDHDCTPSDISAYAIHPGGSKILEAFARALALDKRHLASSYEVLEEWGNMSSCTVLFVLERVLRQAAAGERVYTAAFGPGFTVESALLQIPSS